MFFLFIYFNHEPVAIGPRPILGNQHHHIISIFPRDKQPTYLGPTLRQFYLLLEITLRVHYSYTPAGRQRVELKQCDNNVASVGHSQCRWTKSTLELMKYTMIFEICTCCSKHLTGTSRILAAYFCPSMTRRALSHHC